MERNSLVAAFAAPSVALACVGLNAALASNLSELFNDRAAYAGAVERLSADEASAHANAMFSRADLNRSGALDADEYAALAIVTAELSRLNGFFALDIGDGREFVQLPEGAPTALSFGERARIEAVARTEFYAIAGEDGLLDRHEYTGEQMERFEQADRNNNKVLVKAELTSFAARAAMLMRSEA